MPGALARMAGSLGSAGPVGQNTYMWSYYHGVLRAVGILTWQLKALRASISVTKVEGAWPFIT